MFRPKSVEVIPSARRLVTSLREVGYDFVHAVADLVDNCIEAKASKVSVTMHFNGRDSWLSIVDDGVGMSENTLREAMRYGSQRDYGSSELGKFGLGLKTASSSQCNAFTVASRAHPSKKKIAAYQWDMERVQSTDKWEICTRDIRDLPRTISDALHAGPGTGVWWERLERVLEYKIPEGNHSRRGFFALAADLDAHLGMVFHRFLSGETANGRSLELWLNDSQVMPWDPFARDELGTLPQERQVLPLEVADVSGDVMCTPYILPPKAHFSSPEAFNRYSGPRKWNEQQGFYIYRGDRMIQSGGWCHMRTPDEHTKLARVAIDFAPSLDSLFELNITKTRVILPGELKSLLKPVIDKVALEARRTYTPKERAGQWPGAQLFPEYPTSGGPTPQASPCDARQSQPGTRDEVGSQDGSIAAALEEAANVCNESEALRRIKDILLKRRPKAAEKIGWA